MKKVYLEENYDDISQEWCEGVRELMGMFDLYLLQNFGKCPDFDEDCPACKLWKIRDEIRELIDFDNVIEPASLYDRPD